MDFSQLLGVQQGHSQKETEAMNRRRVIEMQEQEERRRQAHVEQEKRAKAAAREAGTMTEAQKAERDCDLVLPLIFEANIDVNLQGQTMSVQLRAPGTVGGEYLLGWK